MTDDPRDDDTTDQNDKQTDAADQPLDSDQDTVPRAVLNRAGGTGGKLPD